MLTGILSTVITSLLSAIGGWLVRHFQEIIKDKKAADADKAAVDKAVKDLQDAKTPAQLDNAAKGIADNL